MKSVDFLDAVREKHGLDSDNKLAKFLGTTSGRISLIRTGARKIDDALAVKIAEALGEHPVYVMLYIQAERAPKTEIKVIWRQAADKVRDLGKGATAAVLLAWLAGGPLSSNTAQAAPVDGHGNIHYAQYRTAQVAQSWIARVP